MQKQPQTDNKAIEALGICELTISYQSDSSENNAKMQFSLEGLSLIRFLGF
jgi:hypothetical protein